MHMFFAHIVVAISALLMSSLPVQSSEGASETPVVVNWSVQQTPTTRTFVRPSPAEYIKAIDENKQMFRAKITVDGSTSVEFYERPKDIDFYNSTVVVNRQGEPVQTYDIGELIKHQALSLVHVAIVPLGAGTGMLVCEYEGGAVGAREGFAILRFSPSGVELHTLPLTDFGKLVVFRSKPEQAEIWTALSDDAGSDADPRNYATRVCLLRPNGYACGAPKRQPKRFAPGAIDDPGIEIRP